jgi:hypothetical protein
MMNTNEFDKVEDIPEALQSAGLTALTIVIIGHAAFNALFSPIGTSTTDCPKWRAYSVIGAMAAQPILFAMWGMLSPSILKGIPSAIFAVVFVSFAESIRSMHLIGTSKPNSNSFAHVYLALIVFVLSTALLMFVRRYSRYRVVSPVVHKLHRRLPEHSQFGIRHLLSLTAGCAILLALGRLIVPHDALQPPITQTMLLELRQAVSVVATYLGIGCLFLFPAVVVPWITFTIRPNEYLLLAGTVAAWTSLALLAIWLLSTVAISARAEATELVVLFQLGAAASACLSAFILRIFGFRLILAK